MKRVSGNITDFEQLIRGNYLYVNKRFDDPEI